MFTINCSIFVSELNWFSSPCRRVHSTSASIGGNSSRCFAIGWLNIRWSGKNTCGGNTAHPTLILLFCSIQQNDTFSPKVDESVSSDNAAPDKETGTTDATISDIDISADLSNINLDDASELEELEMMIQSSSPFQHSRSGQNYGHGANSFRQSYHHQVSWLFLFIVCCLFRIILFIMSESKPYRIGWMWSKNEVFRFRCAISDKNRSKSINSFYCCIPSPYLIFLVPAMN